MRWDSPFVLAVAATIAVHIILVTATDALVVTHPPRIHEPAPHIELVEIEPPPVLAPPPPAVAPPPPVATDPAPPPPPTAAPRAPSRAAPQIRSAPPASAPAPTNETPAPSEPTTPSGGDQVVQMDDIAPSATGVGVAVGKRTTGHVGRGGTGGGTGSGAGSGAGDEPRPISVAMIKTQPRPRSDYGDLQLGKDYPAEARQLEIAGDIRVRLVIDEQGKVKSKKLLNQLGHGLDELALQRAGTFEFEPARDANDQPVTAMIIWTFHMVPPR
ncbi:MAG TPA: TonB family protein [Kofleriaceae bacterium]